MRRLLVLLFAASLLQGWAGAQSVSARNKFKVGRGAFAHENYKEAIRCFDEALKEDPTYLDAHYMLGLAYYGDKNYAKAEEKLRYVLGLDPQFWVAYQYLGQVLTDQKKYAEARKLFQDMQKVPGVGASAQYLLGVVAYQEKDLKMAERCWTEVARLDPKDARCHNNLGVLRSFEGKHAEALVQFQTAVHLNGENAGYYVNEAWELIALNRTDQARNELQRAQKLADTRHDVGFLAVALLDRLEKHPDRALQRCEEALKRNPDYTLAWLLKARLLEQLGKPAEALEAYRKTLESDPNVAEAEAAVKRLTPPAGSPTPKDAPSPGPK